MTLPSMPRARLFTALRNPSALRRSALIVAAYLGAFTVLDFLARAFEELPGVVAWYPAAGLSFALLLVFGVRFAPALAIASLISSFFIYRLSQPPEMLVLWAFLVALIYGVAAALLRRRAHFDWHLRRLRDVTYLVFAAVLVSALLAVLSVSGSALGGTVKRGEAFGAIFDWWVGETVGILTVAPFLLVYVLPWLLKRDVSPRECDGQAQDKDARSANSSAICATEDEVLRRPVRSGGRDVASQQPPSRPFRRPTLSVVGQAACLVLVLCWVFGAAVPGEFRPLYLVTLPLIWIALQGGFKGITAAIMASNAGVILAIWLFGSDLARLSELELLMIGNCVVGLTMGAVVTERREAEAALKKSEESFRTLIENAVDLIVVLAPDGTCKYVSPSVARILGFRPDEIVGRNTADFIHPDDLSAGEAVAIRLQDLGPVDRPSELRVRHKDGSFRTIEMIGTNLQGSPGVNGTVVNARDITERRQAEEEREELEAKLQQAQRMEAVGSLAGGVAHDFNNMLGVILGHAEMAIEQVDPSRPIHAHLTEIRRAAERSADLTRQLLAFARKQTVAPQVLDLDETVTGMLTMLKRLIGEGIDLVWQPGVGVRPVKVDPSQIDQILANLCINARDAIADVGTITIETRLGIFDEAACAHHPGLVPGEYVLLGVSDDGCGMDRETLSRLFEPFFTTKDVGQGTGLGLATVYGIVKQNNGFVDVQSELGQGTTFTVFLPRHVGNAEQPQTLGPVQAVARGHETVLLVEDEPAMLKMTTRMLESQGYTVLAASTPGEAIRLAQEHIDEIRLLMTDVVMPGMNGRDLAKTVLASHPLLKCLFTSGYTADVIAHHGVLDKGVQFIQKPFSGNDLAAKVRDTLAGE
jgi:PAS domain S-box-containing protein